MIVLSDLVARRLVVVEVVLAVEVAHGLNFTIKRYGCSERRYQSGLLEDWKATGNCKIERGYLLVGFICESRGSICCQSAVILTHAGLSVLENSFRVVLSCA